MANASVTNKSSLKRKSNNGSQIMSKHLSKSSPGPFKQDIGTPNSSNEQTVQGYPEMSTASLEELEKFWDLTSTNQNPSVWTSENGHDNSEDLTSIIDGDIFDMKESFTEDRSEEIAKSAEVTAPSQMITNTEISKNSLERIHSLEGHTNKVTACAFDKNSLLLASVGNDRNLILWDVSQETNVKVSKLYSVEKHSTKNICSIRFLKIDGFFNSQNSDAFLLSDNIPVLLATGGYDKCVTINLINCEKGRSGSNQVSSVSNILSFSGHQRAVTGRDFCPYAFFSSSGIGGMDFIVASLDEEGNLIIWEAWTGKEYLSIKLVYPILLIY